MSGSLGCKIGEKKCPTDKQPNGELQGVFFFLIETTDKFGRRGCWWLLWWWWTGSARQRRRFYVSGSASETLQTHARQTHHRNGPYCSITHQRGC